MGDNIMDNRHELEQQRNHNGLVLNHGLRRGLPDLQTTKPGMFDLKTFITIIGYVLGIPSTFWTLWNVSGWKANILWLLMALFWAFKLFRAIMKWRQEYREQQIELDEKRKRYEKDIWS
jgi:hypothetical protein